MWRYFWKWRQMPQARLLDVHRYLAGSDYLFTTNPQAEASRLQGVSNISGSPSGFSVPVRRERPIFSAGSIRSKAIISIRRILPGVGNRRPVISSRGPSGISPLSVWRGRGSFTAGIIRERESISTRRIRAGKGSAKKGIVLTGSWDLFAELRVKKTYHSDLDKRRQRGYKPPSFNEED